METVAYQRSLDTARRVIYEHLDNADNEHEHSVSVTVQVSYTPPGPYEKRPSIKTILTVTHSEYGPKDES